MRRSGEIPVMVLDPATSSGISSGRHPAELTIRVLTPGEGVAHARVAAVAFEHTVEQSLSNPDVLSLESVRCYVGEVDGQPVTTSVGVTLDGGTAIFGVATLPGFRGRGFGRAVTVRAVADGLAAGASWCWLQSTTAGYRVYRNLGFHTIEAWPCWLSAA